MPKCHVLTVRRSALDARRGVLQAGKLRIRCAIGRSSTSIFKREGDGASPVASMALVEAWRRPGRLPAARVRLPSRLVRARDGWCDAPLHGAYNRPVPLPFPASTERMLRSDRLYDLVVVLDWNLRSRSRWRGSAIFLHIAEAGYEPTQGCVAVAPCDMMRLSPFIRKGSRLEILR